MNALPMILVDSASPLLQKEGMNFKEFPSDFKQIRYFTLLIIQKAPSSIREVNLLEQQISELIKNAIKHGNRKDPNKKVRVWFFFSEVEARVIVQDEGEGFNDIEKWNEFNKKRLECFLERNFQDMEHYISYRTEKSDEYDGGNALFAAVEYWNGGVVFDEKRTTVGVRKIFPRRGIIE
ncbi:MAG: ATP-binding protein [Spirochaetales bacterium]